MLEGNDERQAYYRWRGKDEGDGKSDMLHIVPSINVVLRRATNCVPQVAGPQYSVGCPRWRDEIHTSKYFTV